MQSEVFRRICELGQPVSPPESWGFLSQDDHVIQLPVDGHEIASQLLGEFDAETLQDAGVLNSSDSDESIVPNLVFNDDPLVVMPVKNAAEISDLVSRHGCLRSPSPPCFEVAVDDEMRARCEQWDRKLFFTFDNTTCAVLRMLGLPISFASGLDTLSGDQLRQLFDCADDPDEEFLGDEELSNSDNSAVETAPILEHADHLVLVAWNCTTITSEVSDDVLATATCLHEFERCFGIPTDVVLVWHPSDADLRRIRAGVRARDHRLISESLRQSVEYSAKPVRYFVKHGPHIRSDFGIARRRLIDELSRERPDASSTFLLEKVSEFRQSFRDTFLEPLISDAIGPFTDPLTRPLLMMFIEILEQIHRQDPLLKYAASPDRRHLLEPGEEDLRARLRLFDKAIAIHRELTRIP